MVCPPGVHEYVKGPTPPIDVAVKFPLLAPKQVTLFDGDVIAAKPPGVVPIVAKVVKVQPLESVTVTE